MVDESQVEGIEFKWGKKRGIGGKKKDVQFYDSFMYDGVEYSLYDSVYIYGDNQTEPYIGKLIKIWENPDKTKKVKVLWFFRPCEISNYLAEKHDERELFLASGEGAGLANVNPLEVIAGKCNVVCIANDKRNPQPSDEEIQMADFLFYRAFDVGRLEVLNKIDENIAGVDVKFLFNKVGSQKSSTLEPDSVKKEGGNVIASDKTKILSKESTLGPRKPAKANASSTDALMNENGESKVLGEKNVFVAEQLGGMDDGDKPISKLQVQANVDAKDSLVGKEISIGKKHTFDVAKNVSCNKATTMEEFKDMKHSTNEQRFARVNSASYVGGKLVELSKGNQGGGDVTNVMVALRSKDDFARDESNIVKVMVDQAQEGGKLKVREDFGNLEDIPSKKTKFNGLAKLSNEKSKRSVGVDEAMLSEDKRQRNSTLANSQGVKDTSSMKFKDYPLSKLVTIDPSRIDNVSVKLSRDDERLLKLANDDRQGIDGGPLKKPKLDAKLIKHSHEDLRGASNDPFKKPNFDKKLVKGVNEDSYKSNGGPLKKLKQDEKLTVLSHVKSPKASPKEASNKGKKVDAQEVEIVRRPEVDKSKWFKLTWRDRIQTAHKQGTLVLLQNLDPSYSSAEVEDIVWYAFRESCSAKMIQQTAFSSPHSGQAFVIFKTREAAEKAVTKLTEGCLLLPNKRPLVGTIATPFLGKQSTFHGHLSIDKVKLQLQREMRNAVSTSHCSQSNTLEYEMGIEWWVLQEKFDKAWKALYKRQGDELRTLKAKMKSK